MEKKTLTDLEKTEAVSKEIIRLLEGVTYSHAEGILDYTLKMLRLYTVVTPELSQ